VTRQDAIDQILSIVDGARPPETPAVRSAVAASEAKPTKGARRAAAPSSGAADSATRGQLASPPAPPGQAVPDASNPPLSSAAPAPPAAGTISAQISAPSRSGATAENNGSLGEGGDDEALAEQRHREAEIKRAALNAELARLPMTDLGNVERFRKRFGDQFKWSKALGWFFWDGKRWSRDGAEARVRIASHETVRAIQDEAKALRASAADLTKENAIERGEIAKARKDFEKQFKTKKDQASARLHLVHNADDPDFAAKAEKKRKAKAEKENRFNRILKVLFLQLDAAALADWGKASEMNSKMVPIDAHAAPYLATPIEAFDADPWMINVNNGTLVVDRAAPGLIRFKAHDPADLITKISPVDYVPGGPGAECPTFDAFLDRIQPDEDNRRFVIDWLGYSLTGDATEQQFAVFYGPGGNGKGVIMRIAAYIAGDYARATPIETFLAEASPRNASAPTPERAALPGVRMLMASEPQKNARFDEGFIKMVTGGDKVSARDLNKSQFEFLPVFKLTIQANHRPRISDTTEGIWRRTNLVPFDVVIPRSEWDLKLDDKLKAEASGVFNVLLDGLRSWLLNGLVRSKASEAATKQYREDSDPLGRWLADCTEAAPNERVQSTQAHELFVAWAKATGGPEWKHTGFTNAMKEKGIETRKISVMFFIGIRLTKKISDFVDHLGKPIVGERDDAPPRPADSREDVEIAF
jgi:putative DNA primase/helicase